MQLSTGPTAPAGQAIVGQNNFRHGFTGAFKVLPWEKQQDFHDVLAKLHKCADELRKIRNEKRKWRIGFASQKRNKAADEHKQLSAKIASTSCMDGPFYSPTPGSPASEF